MAGQTRAELEIIRETNRKAMGLSGSPEPSPASLGDFTGPTIQARGMADSVPGGILGLAPKVRISSSFPPVEYEWDPSQPSAAPEGGGSPWGEWLNKHVIRPVVEVGPIRYAPGDGQADYSGVANFLAVGAGLFGASIAGWILWRAFAPRRAS